MEASKKDKKFKIIVDQLKYKINKKEREHIEIVINKFSFFILVLLGNAGY